MLAPPDAMSPLLVRPLRALVVLVIAFSPAFVDAEIFSLQGYDAPESWVLTVPYLFYVYSGPDAPGGGVGPGSRTTVSFHGVGFQSDALSDGDYRGLHLSLVSFADLSEMPEDFCCSPSDVAVQRCSVADEIRFYSTTDTTGHDVLQQTVLSDDKTPRDPTTVVLHKSGVYALVASNCGTRNMSSATTIRGTVVVHSPYGYLSGLDYPKLMFYIGLSGVYLLVGIVWMGLCVVYRAELFKIQHCISGVLAFGIGEACLWSFTYFTWNQVGTCTWPLFIGATFLSVAKSVFSYMLVVVGSMGWGVTKPQLSRSTTCQVVTCSVVLIVLDFTRRMVLFFRNTRGDRMVSTSFVFLVLVPISILNGGIFYWVIYSLGKVIEQLREQNQSEKLKLFESLHRILVFAMAAALLSEVHQMSSITRSMEEEWKMHWFYAEGVSHILFLLVLMGIMCLWRPHENSQRYAFSSQVGDDDVPSHVVSEVPKGMEPTTVGALA